jgi:ATP-dependent RNA helicase DeaD
MTQTPLPPAPETRPAEYVADVTFDELGLSPELRRAISERGYTNPTPVQGKAYGPVRAGRDLIVRSKTGTGKTAAFGMPLIDSIPVGTKEVRALVMCPTRELALQVQQELSALAKYRDIGVTAIYGGASMQQQLDALSSGTAIVVGTPGRVYDHIRRGTLKLSSATHAVLDEADEMLNQGFYEEVCRILDTLPKSRQVLLFSATVPEDIQRLIAKYTTNAETLLLSGDVYTVDHIHHVRYELSDAYPKPRNLLYVMEMENPDNAIIFCNTRDDTELVTAVLNRNGLDAELLNGDLPQKERERVMGRVKRGEVAIMVATDLAARGIDISDLRYVINYSLPEDPAVYLHRVGRTGRIGKKGTALNLTSGRELATLTALEKKYSIVFERRQMPSAEEAARLWAERHVKQIREAGQGSIFEGYLSLANQLKARPDADELIAIMMRSFFTHQRMERAAVQSAEPARESVARESKAPRERKEREGRRGKERERDREERREKRERSPRVTEDAKVTPAAAVVANEAPRVASADAVAPAEPPKERVRAPRAPAASKRLSDRELFERMQRGEPLPPIEDPTTDSTGGGDEPRRERRERKPREPKASAQVEAGQVRLWLNLGKADGVDEAGVVAALEGIGAPSGRVAKTELRGTYSYVHVAEADASGFVALAGRSHGEKSVKVERAK